MSDHNIVAARGKTALQRIIAAYSWERNRRRVLDLVLAHVVQRGLEDNKQDAVEAFYTRVVEGLGAEEMLDLGFDRKKKIGVAERYGFDTN